MTDSEKTKAELIAELAALRAQLNGPALSAPSNDGADDDPLAFSRRDLLGSAWVAPIVLSVPLGLGAMSASQSALAQPPGTLAPTSAPPTAPTSAPTSGINPTAAPTAAPTAFPTAAPGVIPVDISNFDIN